jgi:hypothetical protein
MISTPSCIESERNRSTFPVQSPSIMSGVQKVLLKLKRNVQSTLL